MRLYAQHPHLRLRHPHRRGSRPLYLWLACHMPLAEMAKQVAAELLQPETRDAAARLSHRAAPTFNIFYMSFSVTSDFCACGTSVAPTPRAFRSRHDCGTIVLGLLVGPT